MLEYSLKRLEHARKLIAEALPLCYDEQQVDEINKAIGEMQARITNPKPRFDPALLEGSV